MYFYTYRFALTLTFLLNFRPLFSNSSLEMSHLKMMLELEGLVAKVALELAQLGTHVVTHHVALQTMWVVEEFVADFAEEQRRFAAAAHRRVRGAGDGGGDAAAVAVGE